MRNWKRDAVALAVVLAVATITPAAGADDGDGVAVQRARARMEAARVEATAATQAYIDAVGLLARTEQRISALEARIPRLEARVSELRSLLASRAASLYSGGNSSPFVVVQHTIDTNDLTRGGRAAVLADAAHADVDARADDIAKTQAALESDRAELATAREEQRRLVDESRRHSDAVNAALDRANAILREAEQQQSLERYYAAVAAQHAAALAAYLAALQAGTPPPPEPSEQRPPADPAFAGEIPVLSMPCPVTGVVSFVDDWSQPRSGWRVHQGTDMMAPHGTPNIAVGTGVARMRVGGLGGNAIWLYTDDGHAYYYAHLDRFEGEFTADSTRRVVQGEVIGYTGNTGNAAGGPMHTHFEIHPRNVGPINPYPLLRDMCAEPSAPPPPARTDGAPAELQTSAP